MIANAWGVVDTKAATELAARQAARTYAEAPTVSVAASSAQQAADQALAAYGRDPAKASVRLAIGRVWPLPAHHDLGDVSGPAGRAPLDRPGRDRGVCSRRPLRVGGPVPNGFARDRAYARETRDRSPAFAQTVFAIQPAPWRPGRPGQRPDADTGRFFGAHSAGRARRRQCRRLPRSATVTRLARSGGERRRYRRLVRSRLLLTGCRRDRSDPGRPHRLPGHRIPVRPGPARHTGLDGG